MKSTTIRRIESDDIEEIVDIEETCWHEPWNKKQIENTIKRSHGVVVVGQFGIIGYAITKPAIESVYLVRMAVHRCVQREGVATDLIRHIVRDAKNAGRESIQATVHERNVTAQLFLRRVKFRFTEALHRAGFQNDEYLMRMTLSENNHESRRGDCESVGDEQAATL